MKPFSLTRTFLLFCAVCCIAAIVIGNVASTSIEHGGWIGLIVCVVLFVGVTILAGRQTSAQTSAPSSARSSQRRS